MANPRLEIQAGGKRRIYQILDDELIVGSAPDAGVRIGGQGVQPHHLRLRRANGGFRIESVSRIDPVTVSGEDLLVKDLVHGDVIELGGARLLYLEHGAAASIAPVTSAAAAGARRRAASRYRKDAPNWVLLATLIALGIGTLFVVVRACSSTTWPRTPAHYLDLAQEQFARGARQQALATLDIVLAEATGEVRQRAVELQARIREQIQEAADLPLLQAARSELDSIEDFVGYYLTRDPSHRPAARELIRLLDRWQQRYGEVAARSAAGQELQRRAGELRRRFEAAAEPGQPETADDVLFAAEWQLRLDPRGYREALHRLDAFLQAHPGDRRVAAFREQMLQEGEAWLRRRLNLVDQLLQRGRRSDADAELDKLERYSVVPQWQPLVDRRRR